MEMLLTRREAREDRFRRGHQGVRRRLPMLGVLILIVALTAATATMVEDKPLSPDGRENAVLSFHLWTQGSFSEDGRAPSYLREPLAIAVTAAYMAWFTHIPASAPPEEVVTDPHYLAQIVPINLYYIAGLLLAVWWLAWLLTRSHLAGALSVVGAWAFFSPSAGNLLTETAAGLALVLASGAMVRLAQTRGLPSAALAGVLLGAVALTKAAALYVAPVAILAVAASLALFGLASRRRALMLLAVATLAFAVAVTPWMTRNYVRFGDFTIAQRGGVVLYTRALKDRMTAEEYVGAFYVYAPVPLRTHVFEPLLGFRPEDLEPGGRYQRLMRFPPGEPQAVAAGEVERSVSFFGQALATSNRLGEEMAAAGRPKNEADRVLQKRAEKLIAAAPVRHLATTLPFAWRGLWPFPFLDRSGAVYLFLVAADFLALVTFLALPVLAVRRRRADWLAFSLLGVGFFWFHALATHFIPRYSVPLVPLAVVAVAALGQDLLRRGALPSIRRSHRVAVRTIRDCVGLRMVPVESSSEGFGVTRAR